MKTKRSAAFIMALSAVMLMGSTSVFAHGHGGSHRRATYNNTVASSYSCPYGNATCNQSGYCSVNHYNQYSNVQTTVTPVVVTQTEIPVATEAKDTVVNNVPIETIVKDTTPVTTVPAATLTPATVVPATTTATVATTPTPVYTPPYVCPYGNASCNQAGYCINNGNCYGYGNGYGNGYGCNGGGCRGYRY